MATLASLRPGRTWLFRVIAISTSLAVSLVLVEAGLRFFHLAPAGGLATVSQRDFDRLPGLYVPEQQLSSTGESRPSLTASRSTALGTAAQTNSPDESRQGSFGFGCWAIPSPLAILSMMRNPAPPREPDAIEVRSSDSHDQHWSRGIEYRDRGGHGRQSAPPRARSRDPHLQRERRDGLGSPDVGSDDGESQGKVPTPLVAGVPGTPPTSSLESRAHHAGQTTKSPRSGGRGALDLQSLPGPKPKRSRGFEKNTRRDS